MISAVKVNIKVVDFCECLRQGSIQVSMNADQRNKVFLKRTSRAFPEESEKLGLIAHHDIVRSINLATRIQETLSNSSNDTTSVSNNKNKKHGGHSR